MAVPPHSRAAGLRICRARGDNVAYRLGRRRSRLSRTIGSRAGKIGTVAYFVVDALLRTGYGAGVPQAARIFRPGVARPGVNNRREAFPAIRKVS